MNWVVPTLTVCIMERLTVKFFSFMKLEASAQLSQPCAEGIHFSTCWEAQEA